MIIHHPFDMTPREFETRKAWPTLGQSDGQWKGEYASQSPLNAFFVDTKGSGTSGGAGAEGSKGYLALPAANSDEFYAEATPQWERPQKAYDLRNTRITLYLKAITPIQVNAGFKPYIFIDDWDDTTQSFCGWYHNQVLEIGSDWTLNSVDLRNDEKQWTRYSNTRPLDAVLARVGFIGVMYLKGTAFRGVGARGILGIDEMKFNIPIG